MKASEPPLIVSKIINAPISKVWDALTVHEQMLVWYFEEIPNFKPELGFTTSFVIKHEDRTYTHKWEIIQVNVPHAIGYRWNYEEHDGDSKVVFQLEEENGQTKASVNAIILEDFPDLPEFKRESGVAGWNYFMDRLKAFAEADH